MEYQQIKTLKAQVEHILKTRPETRNSDAELVLIVCTNFNHDPIQKATSVERCRRWFNQHRRYLPTNGEVARQRKMNMDEWRVVMGYPTQSGTFVPPSRENPKFEFPSKTKKGVKYTVVDFGSQVVCDCPSFHYRGACPHAKTVLEAERLKVAARLF